MINHPRNIDEILAESMARAKALEDGVAAVWDVTCSAIAIHGLEMLLVALFLWSFLVHRQSARLAYRLADQRSMIEASSIELREQKVVTSKAETSAEELRGVLRMTVDRDHELTKYKLAMKSSEESAAATKAALKQQRAQTNALCNQMKRVLSDVQRQRTADRVRLEQAREEREASPERRGRKKCQFGPQARAAIKAVEDRASAAESNVEHLQASLTAALEQLHGLQASTEGAGRRRSERVRARSQAHRRPATERPRRIEVVERLGR